MLYLSGICVDLDNGEIATVILIKETDMQMRRFELIILGPILTLTWQRSHTEVRLKANGTCSNYSFLNPAII